MTIERDRILKLIGVMQYYREKNEEMRQSVKATPDVKEIAESYSRQWGDLASLLEELITRRDAEEAAGSNQQ